MIQHAFKGKHCHHKEKPFITVTETVSIPFACGEKCFFSLCYWSGQVSANLKSRKYQVKVICRQGILIVGT